VRHKDRVIDVHSEGVINGVDGVIELGEVERRAYYAMEYVDRTLADRLHAGPLVPMEAARLAQTIALTLEYVRSKDMVHLNLDPPSILLASETAPRLFDVQLTSVVKAWDARRWIIGLRPAFNPPEDLAGERSLSSKGDVYRVGAALYAMLTGQPPFRGDPMAIVAAVLEQTPVAPRQMNANISRDMEAICLRCLEKHPEHRYSSLRNLADDLECLSARA